MNPIKNNYIDQNIQDSSTELAAQESSGASPSIEPSLLSVERLLKISAEELEQLLLESPGEELESIGKSIPSLNYEEILEKVRKFEAFHPKVKALYLTAGFLSKAPEDPYRFESYEAFNSGIILTGQTPSLVAEILRSQDEEKYRQLLEVARSIPFELLASLLSRAVLITHWPALESFCRFLLQDESIPKSIIDAVNWLPLVYTTPKEIVQQTAFANCVKKYPWKGESNWNSPALYYQVYSKSQIEKKLLELDQGIGSPESARMFLYHIWIRGITDLQEIYGLILRVAEKHKFTASEVEAKFIHKLLNFFLSSLKQYLDAKINNQRTQYFARPVRIGLEDSALPFITAVSNLCEQGSRGLHGNMLQSRLPGKTDFFLSKENLDNAIETKLCLLEQSRSPEEIGNLCAELCSILKNVWYFGPPDWRESLRFITDSAAWRKWTPHCLKNECFSPQLHIHTDDHANLRHTLEAIKESTESLSQSKFHFPIEVLLKGLPSIYGSTERKTNLTLAVIYTIYDVLGIQEVDEEPILDLYRNYPIVERHTMVLEYLRRNYEKTSFVAKLFDTYLNNAHERFIGEELYLLDLASCLFEKGASIQAGTLIILLDDNLLDREAERSLVALLRYSITNSQKILTEGSTIPQMNQMITELCNKLISCRNPVAARLTLSLLDKILLAIQNKRKVNLPRKGQSGKGRRRKSKANTTPMSILNAQKAKILSEIAKWENAFDPQIEAEKKRKEALAANGNQIAQALRQARGAIGESPFHELPPFALEAFENKQMRLEELKQQLRLDKELDQMQCQEKIASLIKEFQEDLKEIEKTRRAKDALWNAELAKKKVAQEVSQTSDLQKLFQTMQQRIENAQNLQREEENKLLSSLTSMQDSSSILAKQREYEEWRDRNEKELMESLRRLLPRETKQTAHPLEKKVKELKTRIQELEEENSSLQIPQEEVERPKIPPSETIRYNQTSLIALIQGLKGVECPIDLDKLEKKIIKGGRKTTDLTAILNLLPLEKPKTNGSHKTARYKEHMCTISSHTAEADWGDVQTCYDTVGGILQKYTLGSR